MGLANCPDQNYSASRVPSASWEAKGGPSNPGVAVLSWPKGAWGTGLSFRRLWGFGCAACGLGFVGSTLGLPRPQQEGRKRPVL